MRFKALLVANWQYNDTSGILTPLKGPRNDLRVMRDALSHRRFGLFELEDITYFENLTYARMPVEFLQFLEHAGKEDRLLLYFSGHGERRSDERLALCGVDTTHKLLEATSFDTNQLRSWIEEYNRAPSTIVILDCCYAGQMKGTLSEQTLVGSLGVGTMVLASGANKPAKDAIKEGDPSPFTAALTKILLDPEAKGDQDGWLTADSVYDRLMRFEPPLVPEPHRNIQSQGTFPLAKRELPAMPKRPVLKGFRAPDWVEVIDLTFEAATVAARHDTGSSERLELVALDPHRQTAVRRLSQLADAVIRVPEYAEDPWYQQAVQKAWNCVGVNLFETAMPSVLRDRISSGIDGTGRRLLKIRLTFGQNRDSLESYPWEYLQMGRVPGAEAVADDESLPLALRPGLLIERVACVQGAAPADLRSAGAARTVGIVNCLQDKLASAAARVTEDLTKLADLNVIMDLKGGRARWGGFLDALAQAPGLLLLFLPLRRGPQGVEIGFIADDPGQPEWHLGSELITEFRNTGLTFDAVVFVTFAAKPGKDSFRGTLELARALAHSGIGPVVFVCHNPGLEAHILDPERDAFPVLFVDALTREVPLDQAFYYAKNRVTRMGSAAVRRAFGVPGYYAITPAEPRPAPPSAVTLGGRSTKRSTGGARAEEGSKTR